MQQPIQGALGTLLCLLTVAPCVRAEGVDATRHSVRATFTSEEVEFFERRVRPILVQHCYECHSTKSETLQAGLRLDSRGGVMMGGDSGPAVATERPRQSLLVKALRYEDFEMPPEGQLPEPIIADLEKWVAMGLPWPAEQEPPVAEMRKERRVGPAEIAAGRQYWAFQPLTKIVLPKRSTRRWPRTRIDAFILNQLDKQRLAPSPAATRRTLIRRVYFDLVGLPPSFAEVEEFAATESPAAYAALVDRLLASPHYGERWGRYWLDVARYAEDHPNGALPPRFPHRYRDWVINSLNADLPYDDFVRRQLAADLMPDLPLNELTALGFLGLSPDYVVDSKFAKEVVQRIVADEWDERLDAVSRGLLGLTVACARCHDHKFDPISTEDYYALAGVMASTQLVERPTSSLFEEDADYIASLTEELRYHQKRYKSRYNQRLGLIKNNEPDIYRYDKEILESASEVQRILSLLPEDYAQIPRVNAVRDAASRVNPEFYVIRELESPEAKFWRQVEYRAGEARDLPVHLRGSVTKLGKVVPRRFLSVLSNGEPQPFREGSGRRELAEAIFTDARGLAARVIVNRVWGWHFHQHIVDTPSNFGVLGSHPTHTQLLEDLSVTLIESGWSLKMLHREIVLSATYRQQSRHDAQQQSIDPANVFLSRMPSRRLDLESWRDAMLMVTGDLSEEIGGPSFELDDTGNPRRTVYGKVSRTKQPKIHQLFDFPEMTRHSERRTITTTTLQQLYFLNSSFVISRAEAACRRTEDAQQAGDRVRSLYRLILSREPTSAEKESAELFLAEGGQDPRNCLMLAQALLASNEFLFVD